MVWWRMRSGRLARGLPLALYGLMLVTGIAQNAIVPVLPELTRHFGLSDAGAAELLALPSLATLVASVPVGMLADRYGPRVVTLGAAFVLAGSCFGQATPIFAVFVTGRVALGLAYAAVWTAGLTWLARFPSGDGARRLGATVTVSSIGVALGPAAIGAGVVWLGDFAPFGLLGLVCVAAVLWLLRLGPGSAPRVTREQGEESAPCAAGVVPTSTNLLRQTGQGGVRRLGGGLGVAILALVASGALSSSLTLLVPLQLARAGQGAAVIGVAFSAAGAGYAVVSAVVSRLGARAATRRVVLVAMAGLVVAVAPAVASPGLAGALVVLALMVPPRSTIGTVAYAVGLAAAPENGVQQGLAMGALNGLWATAMMVSPLLVGAAAGVAGYRGAYAILALGLVAALLGAVWCRSSVGLGAATAGDGAGATVPT